ncbi:MAG: ribosome biogenesis protein [Candidatus Nitrosocosmicus sp.]
MLNLVIADTALETIPIEIFRHDSLKKIRNSGKKPSEILLDRTFHHFAITSSNLKEGYKRARPDILHIILLTVLATPLFKDDQLKVFVHTINNQIIKIADKVRIPKSYSRYEGLILDLIKNKKITTKEGTVLLELKENLTFSDLLKKIVKPDITIGLTINGVSNNFESVSDELLLFKNPCIVLGGFPKGHFSTDIENCLEKKYSISSVGLESHVVISRLLYEYEKKNSFSINSKKLGGFT